MAPNSSASRAESQEPSGGARTARTKLRAIPRLPGFALAIVCGLVYFALGSATYRKVDRSDGRIDRALTWTARLRTSLFAHHALTANAWLHGRLHVTGDEIERRYLQTCIRQNDLSGAVDASTEDLWRIYNDRQADRLRSLGATDEIVEAELKAHAAAPYHDWVHRRVDDEDRYFAYWPPLPAVLMLPMVAIGGPDVSDVLVGNLIGAFTAMFVYLLFRELGTVWPQLTTGGCVGLTLLYCLGTVQMWQSSLGQVWFLTQVSGGLFLVIAVWLGIRAMRRPGWIVGAGLALGVAFLGRLTMVLASPFFLTALWLGLRGAFDRPASDPHPEPLPADERARSDRGPRLAGAIARHMARFALPLVFVIAGQLAFNKARFGAFTEFGQGLLTEATSGGNPVFSDDFKAYGRFNPHFLPRNAFEYFVDVRTVARPGEASLTFDGEGNSLFAISPALLYVLLCWRRRGVAALPDRRADGIVLGLFAVIAVCVMRAAPPTGGGPGSAFMLAADCPANMMMGGMMAVALAAWLAQLARHRDALCLAVLAGLLPGTIALLLFHGTGFYTFGPRYLVDSLIFFVILAGFGMRGRLTTVATVLIVVSIAVNFWGTYHFAMEQF